MRTKVTLTIDRALLPPAKRYARAHGRSLSQLVETNLRSLAESEEESFSALWRGKFKPARRQGPRYRRLASRYL